MAKAPTPSKPGAVAGLVKIGAHARKERHPFTRPGQRDSNGNKIDSSLQPGGDPGDQLRLPNTKKASFVPGKRVR